eukprot:GEZU01011746.1.p1 GENE.GEZU01011746.1~~GEZU01011746.1.p1  ORF type:complete len:126 (+),score=24.95 GEZU01011746.1:200-577(+)
MPTKTTTTTTTTLLQTITEVMEDYLHPELTFSGSAQPMQLDVFVPSLSLAFEFQGQQHFADVHVFGSSARTAAKTDQEKSEACSRVGVSLVVVPYWWDQTAASLVEMISSVRPDLVDKLVASQRQ